MASSAGAIFPTSLSTSDPLYATWSTFCLTTLGVVPAQPDSTSGLWAIFLKSRYSGMTALNTAYRSAYTGFDAVPFPGTLPVWPGPLSDWYKFLGIQLIQANAHQFTVFLPLAPADAASTFAQRSKLRLAQRVIDLEKPAHTTYDVRFYWAFFRLGEARLGFESVLDQGSRATQLLQPIVLGDSFVGAGYLSREQPGEPRHRPFLKGGTSL